MLRPSVDSARRANGASPDDARIRALLLRRFVDYVWIAGGDLAIDPFPPKLLLDEGGGGSFSYDANTGVGCRRRVGGRLLGAVEEIFDCVRSDDDAEIQVRYRLTNPGWKRAYPAFAHEGRVTFGPAVATNDDHNDDDQRRSFECGWEVRFVPYACSAWFVRALTSFVVNDFVRNLQRNVVAVPL